MILLDFFLSLRVDIYTLFWIDLAEDFLHCGVIASGFGLSMSLGFWAGQIQKSYHRYKFFCV